VLDDREAEARATARARLVGPVEPLEQARHVGCGDPLAVVGDGEDGGLPARRDLHRAPTARPGIADRVREQVLEHDPQHPRPQRQLHPLVGADDEGHLGALGPVGERPRDLVDDRLRLCPSQRDDLPPRLELAEEEHVVDQFARLLHLLPGLLDEYREVGIRQPHALEQDEQAGERRPQLV
jgi:hypothetical protein